eukprot:2279954-Amphidinium_carterae.1
MATPEERLAALEQQLQSVVQRNTQLEGMMQGLQARPQQGAVAPAAQAPAYHMISAVDTRLLGKPKSFDGRDEAWPGWATIFRAYCGAISESLLEAMDEVEDPLTAEPANASLSDAARACSHQLYYVLAMLLEGKAQEKVNIVGRGEGLLLWRRLIEEFESKLVSRKTGLLQQVLGFQFTDD